MKKIFFASVLLVSCLTISCSDDAFMSEEVVPQKTEGSVSRVSNLSAYYPLSNKVSWYMEQKSYGKEIAEQDITKLSLGPYSPDSGDQLIVQLKMFDKNYNLLDSYSSVLTQTVNFSSTRWSPGTNKILWIICTPKRAGYYCTSYQ
jgi:hypothetical protein